MSVLSNPKHELFAQELAKGASRRFYVYALIDPRDDAPFYIGKGTGERRHVHLKEFYRSSGWNGEKRRRIGEIVASGREPEARILADSLTEAEALKTELEIIRSIGWGKLTNILPGSRTRTERAIDWAKTTLASFKSFEDWCVEHRRSEADKALFGRIVREVEAIASGEVPFEFDAPGLTVKVR